MSAAKDPRDEELALLRRLILVSTEMCRALSIETTRLERLILSMLQDRWLGQYVLGCYYGELRWVQSMRALVAQLRGSGTMRVWPDAGDESAIQKAEAELAQWKERDEAAWDQAVAEAQERPAVKDPRDVLLSQCANELQAAASRHWARTGVGLSDHEQDCSECRQIYLLLIHLRIAGVEVCATEGTVSR